MSSHFSVGEISAHQNIYVGEVWKTQGKRIWGDIDAHCEDIDCRGCESYIGIWLCALLGSFDNLFYRQCLVHTKTLSF